MKITKSADYEDAKRFLELIVKELIITQSKHVITKYFQNKNGKIIVTFIVNY